MKKLLLFLVLFATVVDAQTKLQVRRGNAADRPILSNGEPSLDRDSLMFWVGTDSGNVAIGGAYMGYGYHQYATDAGSTDAYAVTLPNFPVRSYFAGMTVRFKANTVNTGSATLNVNGLGAKAILKDGSSALDDGDIPASQVVTLTYDGTNFQFQASAQGTSNEKVYIVGDTVRQTYVDGALAQYRTNSAFQVALVGDSHTEYMSQQMSVSMWDALGYAGLGWVPFANNRYSAGGYATVTLTGGWTSVDQSAVDSLWGVDGNAVHSATTTDSVTYTAVVAPFNQARIWYYRSPNGGSFRVNAAGTLTTVSANGTAGLGMHTVVGLSATASNQSIYIKVVSGAVTLYGIDTRDTASYGALTHNLGNAGSKLSEWDDHTEFLSAFIDTVQPSATVLFLGYNDVAVDTTDDAVLSGLLSPIIDSVRTHNYGKDIILASGFKRGTATGDNTTVNANLSAWNTTQKTLAASKNISHFDGYNLFPLYSVASSYNIYQDTIHLSSTGRSMWAALFRANILGSVAGQNSGRMVLRTGAGDHLTLDAIGGSTTATIRFRTSGTETGAFYTSPSIFNLVAGSASDLYLGAGGVTGRLIIKTTSNNVIIGGTATDGAARLNILPSTSNTNIWEGYSPTLTTTIKARVDTSGNYHGASATMAPSTGDALTLNGTGTANSVLRFKDDGTERGAIYTGNGSSNLNIWGGSGGGLNLGGNGTATAIQISSAQVSTFGGKIITTHPIDADSDVADTSAFSGTATRAAVYIAGALPTDKYVASPRVLAGPGNEALPTSNDVLMCAAKADSLIILRPASGTSGLKFSYIRIE